jgi:hypothetical protein
MGCKWRSDQMLEIENTEVVEAGKTVLSVPYSMHVCTSHFGWWVVGCWIDVQGLVDS